MRALTSAAIMLAGLAVPAPATVITNTFLGHIVPKFVSTGITTTADVMQEFGGGNLIGKIFKLTMTVDTSHYYFISPDPVHPNNIGGGSVYGGSNATNPVTATLSIGGHAVTISDTGFATLTLSGGKMFTGFQAFLYDPAQFTYIRTLETDITVLVPASADLTVALPPMLLSRGDFTFPRAFFRDDTLKAQFGLHEELALQVEAVNTGLGVPEPSSLMLLVGGLVAFVRRRRDAGS